MPADSDAELSPATPDPMPEAKPSAPVSPDKIKPQNIIKPDPASEAKLPTPEPEPAPADPPKPTQAIALKNPQAQVRLSRKDTVVQVWLPDPDQTPTHWLEIWDRLKQRLSTGERFWQAGTVAHLLAGKHLLDGRQLQAIAEALAQAQLDLRTVATCRRQTAVVAAGAGYSVEQTLPQTTATAPVAGSAETWAEPLYLKSTVRSGIEVSHPGTVVVFGDTNPGSEIIATGDILVVGRLRGIAHAGAEGNRACQIFALKMEAVQLRIAEAIARPPATPIDQLYPEIAYITTGGIRLAPAPNFFKTHSFSMATESWVESP